MTILVTGATGTVGRHLVQQLTEAGHSVRALSRTPAAARLPSGVDVVAADLRYPESLRDAFDGVTAVHLITFGGDAGEPLTTGPQLVELAARAGVTRVSVLSGWQESSVEVALRASSLGWTLLVPLEFMSGALEWAASVRQSGTVRLLANWPSAVVHEADIAAVAAAALTRDGLAGHVCTITGPRALTPAQRTRLIARALGQEVRFEQLTEDQERERLRALGLDEEHVTFGVQLAASPPPEAGVVRATVESVTGRLALSFERWVDEHLDAFRCP